MIEKERHSLYHLKKKKTALRKLACKRTITQSGLSSFMMKSRNTFLHICHDEY